MKYDFWAYCPCLTAMLLLLLAFGSSSCWLVATFFTRLFARFKFSITCSLTLQKGCISVCLIVYNAEMHQQDEHHSQIWNLFGNDLNSEIRSLFKNLGWDVTHRFFCDLKFNFAFIVSIFLFLWFCGYCMCNPCER